MEIPTSPPPGSSFISKLAPELLREIFKAAILSAKSSEIQYRLSPPAARIPALNALKATCRRFWEVYNAHRSQLELLATKRLVHGDFDQLRLLALALDWKSSLERIPDLYADPYDDSEPTAENLARILDTRAGYNAKPTLNLFRKLFALLLEDEQQLSALSKVLEQRYGIHISHEKENLPVLLSPEKGDIDPSPEQLDPRFISWTIEVRYGGFGPAYYHNIASKIKEAYGFSLYIDDPNPDRTVRPERDPYDWNEPDYYPVGVRKLFPVAPVSASETEIKSLEGLIEDATTPTSRLTAPLLRKIIHIDILIETLRHALTVDIFEFLYTYDRKDPSLFEPYENIPGGFLSTRELELRTKWAQAAATEMLIWGTLLMSRTISQDEKVKVRRLIELYFPTGLLPEGMALSNVDFDDDLTRDNMEDWRDAFLAADWKTLRLYLGHIWRRFEVEYGLREVKEMEWISDDEFELNFRLRNNWPVPESARTQFKCKNCGRVHGDGPGRHIVKDENVANFF